MYQSGIQTSQKAVILQGSIFSTYFQQQISDIYDIIQSSSQSSYLNKINFKELQLSQSFQNPTHPREFLIFQTKQSKIQVLFMDEGDYQTELYSKRSLNYEEYKRMKKGGAVIKVQQKGQNSYLFDHIQLMKDLLQLKLSQNFEQNTFRQSTNLTLETIRHFYNWNAKGRFVYLELETSQENGKIICLIELYQEVTPLICKNFHSLCLQDQSNEFGEKLIFKGKEFDSYRKNQFLSIQKIVENGSDTIYFSPMKDESYQLSYNQPFILGALNQGQKNTNSSRFLITLDCCPQLQNQNVAFGKLILGAGKLLRYLRKVEKQQTPFSIKIKDTGEFNPEDFKYFLDVNGQLELDLTGKPTRELINQISSFEGLYNQFVEQKQKKEIANKRQILQLRENVKTCLSIEPSLKDLYNQILDLLMENCYTAFMQTRKKEILDEGLTIFSELKNRKAPQYKRWEEIIQTQLEQRERMTQRAQFSQKIDIGANSDLIDFKFAFKKMQVDKQTFTNNRREGFKMFIVHKALTEICKDIIQKKFGINVAEEMKQIRLEQQAEESGGLNQKMQDFGAGGFASVEERVDIKTLQISAVKKFLGRYDQQTSLENYFQEKCSYLRVQRLIPMEELKRYLITLDRADNQNLCLYFQPGLISLDEFYKERLALSKESEPLKFTTAELRYIFRFSIKFVLLMRKYGLVHNDIKPENFTIVCGEHEDKHRMEIRVIDLGLANDTLQVPGFTVKYYMNPLRQYHTDAAGRSIPVMRTMDEKFRNEVFTVLRTMQDLMITRQDCPVSARHFSLPGHAGTPRLTTEDITKTLDEIQNNFYREEYGEDPQFRELLDFMRHRCFPEKYDWAELEAFVERIADDHIEDKSLIVHKKVTQKRQVLQQKFNIMDLLFGIKSYIPLKYSMSYDYSHPQDLMAQCIDFVQSKREGNQVTVLLGNSGGGKSLFLVQLYRHLEEIKEAEGTQLAARYDASELRKYRIFLLKLNEFNRLMMERMSAVVRDKYDLKKQVQQKIRLLLSARSGPEEKLLFLLDGYDEYGVKEQFSEGIFELPQNPHVKFIITSRIYFLSKEDIINSFVFSRNEAKHFPNVHYLCPFDDQQKSDLIEKVIQQAKYLRQNFIKFKFLPNKEDYLKYFRENQTLKQLSSGPFTLRLIITILPRLLKSNQDRKITKFSIYESFTRNWYFNELKRASEDYAELLADVWGLEVQENDIYNYELVSKATFSDIDDFNVYVCWYLLQKGKIVFTLEEIEALLSAKSEPGEVELLLRVSPLVRNEETGNYNYLHKSIYEYYLAKGINQDLQLVKDMKFSDPLFFGQYLSLGQLSLNMQQASISQEPEVFLMVIEQSEENNLSQQLRIMEGLTVDVKISKFLVINARIIYNQLRVSQIQGIDHFLLNAQPEKTLFRNQRMEIYSNKQASFQRIKIIDSEYFLQIIDKTLIMTELSYHPCLGKWSETYQWIPSKENLHKIHRQKTITHKDFVERERKAETKQKELAEEKKQDAKSGSEGELSEAYEGDNNNDWELEGSDDDYNEEEQNPEDGTAVPMNREVFKQSVREAEINNFEIVFKYKEQLGMILQDFIPQKQEFHKRKLLTQLFGLIDACLQLRNQFQIYPWNISPESIIVNEGHMKIIDYMCMKNDEGNRHYYSPELRFINEFNVMDLIGKFDFQKIVVFSLGLTFLRFVVKFEESEIDRLYEGGFEEAIRAVPDEDLRGLFRQMLAHNIEQRATYSSLLEQISGLMGGRRSISIILQFNDKLQWVFQLFKKYGIPYDCNLQSDLSLRYRFHGNYDFSQNYSSTFELDLEEVARRIDYPRLQEMVHEYETDLVTRGHDNSQNYGYYYYQERENQLQYQGTLAEVHQRLRTVLVRLFAGPPLGDNVIRNNHFFLQPVTLRSVAPTKLEDPAKLEHICENKAFQVFYKLAAPSYRTHSEKAGYLKSAEQFIRQIRDWSLTEGRDYPQGDLRNFNLNRVLNDKDDHVFKEIEVSSIHHNMALIQNFYQIEELQTAKLQGEGSFEFLELAASEFCVIILDERKRLIHFLSYKTVLKQSHHVKGTLKLVKQLYMKTEVKKENKEEEEKKEAVELVEKPPVKIGQSKIAQLIEDIYQDRELLGLLQKQKYPCLNISVNDRLLVKASEYQIELDSSNNNFELRLSADAYKILDQKCQRSGIKLLDVVQGEELRIMEVGPAEIRFNRACNRCQFAIERKLGFFVCLETDEYFCFKCQPLVVQDVRDLVKQHQPSKHFRLIYISPTTTQDMLQQIEIGALRVKQAMTDQQFYQLTHYQYTNFVCRKCQSLTEKMKEVIQYVCMVCPIIFCNNCFTAQLENKTNVVNSTRKFSHQYVNKQRFGHTSAHPCVLYLNHILHDYVDCDY